MFLYACRRYNTHVPFHSSVEVQLPQALSAFINFFNWEDDRLKEIIYKLEKAEAKEQQIRNGARTGKRLAMVGYGFGAGVDVAAAVLTGGLSLAIPGFTAGVLGTAAHQGSLLLERRRTIRVKKSVKSLGRELNEMVTHLREILRKILIALEIKITYEPKWCWMDLRMDFSEAYRCVGELRPLLPSLEYENRNIRSVLVKLNELRPTCQQLLYKIEYL